MLVDINEIMSIDSISYDKWNSVQWAIQCTELGFNMVPYSQGTANYNQPTKELERLIKEDGDNIVIDKSSNIL